MQRILMVLHVQVFHAGTRVNECGDVIAVGGRVLGVTAMGQDVADAQRRAYEVATGAGTLYTVESLICLLCTHDGWNVQAVDTISWDKGFCRRDIGWRAVQRLSS